MDKPDNKVKVKISYCKKCNGWVRSSIEHLMDVDSTIDFYKEVKKYDLEVKTTSLIKFRKMNTKYCNCK